ncbi:4Fe-4S binding protein [bacterium]|nr:4Fe-4S binding protein [bacterium]
MPWVDKAGCLGCGICVDECPTNTIFMVGGKAKVDMKNCIHCGVCHDVCPENVVKHDSELIPGDVEANITETIGFMNACAEYLGDEKEKQKCLIRMIKHFNKDKIVAEKTLEKLQTLKKG